MVLLWPRENNLDLLSNTFINKENVKSLANAADEVWEAVNNKDLEKFAEGFLKSFNAQIKMFPAMVNDRILKEIDKYKDQAIAWKLAGAGGAGYLILVSDKPVEGAMKIKIRRKEVL
jgi:galactokinase/mevalonate kinase-like predicted kinase